MCRVSVDILKRAPVSALMVALAGVGALWLGTDGFTAFTTETARRIAVREHPRPLPEIMLEDQAGRPLTFADYRGDRLLVEFIYTRCPDLCLALGDSFERLNEKIEKAGLEGRAHLLTISFDPRDDRAALVDFADRFGGATRIWRFARARDSDDLARLLKAVGVVVKPDGFGGFVHNAALYLINEKGYLAEILDDDADDAALAALAAGR